MKAKEALEVIEYYSCINEMAQDKMQKEFDIALTTIKQALTELDEYKKSDASKEQSSIYYFNEFKRAERELGELKKRDMAMKPVEAMITWQCGNCGKEIRNTFNSCPYCETRIDWSGIYGRNKDE